MKTRAGFTLVEIMVVVAVVMTLATLAISSVLRARLNANEMAATASCRTAVTACQNFYANSYPHTYPSGLSDLIIPVSNPPYIDSILASGTKQGYRFTYILVDPESFALNVDPVSPGKTGSRHFFSDETSIIRANAETQAGPGDAIVQ
ncbi:MAG: type II secretion system GspH family protein [Candidatus Omnitrophica bacterium]|nr:type II secretion system GspH family protein [Candidatus Omnitrophota bacterium]